MIHVDRSMPPPVCLEIEKAKAGGSYSCGDVLERLKTDFRNKCYLCESSEIANINVEHFVPHRGDVDLKFSWKNLFLCCVHCNSTKHVRTVDLYCCTDADDTTGKELRYHMNPFPGESVEIEALTEAQKAINTKVLLSEIYNGTTKLKTIESANLRSLLLKEIRDFQNYLIEYFDATNSKEEKDRIENQIQKNLSPASQFTAFKNWIIRNNTLLEREFSHWLVDL